MNTKTISCVAVSMLGLCGASAQTSFFGFGPWAGLPDPDPFIHTHTGALDIPPSLTEIRTHVVFSTSVTITPSDSTPINGTENFTFSLGSLKLELSSASIGLDGGAEPVELEVGSISGSYLWTAPGTKPSSGGWEPISFIVSKTVNFVTAFTPSDAKDDFTVTWTSMSGATFGGGKSGTGSHAPGVGGNIAVPEPAEYALFCGLALLGYAAYSRRRKA